MSDKLDELSKKIAAAKNEREESPENLKKTSDSHQKEMSFASKLGIELAAGVGVGGIVGYFFDQVFNTIPLFLIIFLVLGAIAGFWNVYKLALKDESAK